MANGRAQMQRPGGGQQAQQPAGGPQKAQQGNRMQKMQQKLSQMNHQELVRIAMQLMARTQDLQSKLRQMQGNQGGNRQQQQAQRPSGGGQPTPRR